MKTVVIQHNHLNTTKRFKLGIYIRPAVIGVQMREQWNEGSSWSSSFAFGLAPRQERHFRHLSDARCYGMRWGQKHQNAKDFLNCGIVSYWLVGKTRICPSFWLTILAHAEYYLKDETIDERFASRIERPPLDFTESWFHSRRPW